MTVSLDEFVEKLDAIGLLSAEEVSAVTGDLPSDRRPADVPSLAKVLIAAGKLTRYQAQAVYQDKTKHLVFGEYVVTDKIGAGGMGLVLKATHKRMKRTVAVKVLPAARLKDEAAIERFYREVEAAAKLNHTNIVTAHDAGEHEGLHYLVMEYVEGRDLAAILHEHGPLPVEQAVECVRQAAQGLQYAHEEGIVHRDIKPGNLLLDKKGTVKILDMGLARLNVGDLGEGEAKQPERPEQLTQSGQIMGTVDYMAPEQAEDTRKADHRADIYALGCTLFRLVTGSPVYERDTVMQKLLAHREDEIPSMAQYRSEVPARLAGVFQRMVAKKPEDRYQSMTEVIAALDTAFVPAPQAAKPAAPKRESSSSSALSAFFDHIGGQQVATKPQTAVKPEETIDRQPSGEDTGDSVANVERGGWAPPTDNPDFSVKRMVGGARRAKIWIAGGGALLAIVMVVVGAIAVIRPNGPAMPGSADDNEPERFSKPANGPPALAKAPFGEKEAKEYQEAWAKHLGVEVEREIELPGGEKLTMVLIPPGDFMMGSTVEEQERFLAASRADQHHWPIGRIPTEGPKHKVRITRAFYLGKYEVTQAQWNAVMGNNPSQFKDDPAHPVEMVSWDDIQPFLDKLNETSSAHEMTFVLPTEAQWESACRAGTTDYWHCGNDEFLLRESSWFLKNAGGTTHPVGNVRPNNFGLYDMHGNVWEWCADWFAADYYAKASLDNPGGPPSGTSRVNRGGGWRAFRPWDGRSAARNYDLSTARHNNLGFRISARIEPPLAKAPFGEKEAKKHQQAWADYLGVEVERDIELPGGEKLTMVLIPPGEFIMGSTVEEQAKFLEEAKAANDTSAIDRIANEGPQHRVRITRPFYLGKYEVTQAQWQSVMGHNPSQIQDSPSHPVERVNWDDIQPFFAELSMQGVANDMNVALPTEAQWEFACRAGTASAYSFEGSASELPQYGWFKANSGARTQSVGELKPNALGLHDMHGNVWEWCIDWFNADYYAVAPMDDPTGPAVGSRRVCRGGSWDNAAGHCRSAYRDDSKPSNRNCALGFRLAAEIVDAPAVGGSDDGD